MSWSSAGGTAYRTEWNGPGHIPFFDRYHKHRWVSPPDELPKPGTILYLRGKQPLHERIGEYIVETPLVSFPDVNGVAQFSITDKGKKVDLLEIEIAQPAWYAFKREDGELIYKLLQPLATDKSGV